MEIFAYYPVVFITLAAIFGLIIGSFLNVVIYRLPKMLEREWLAACIEAFPKLNANLLPNKITLSTPASSCSKCNHKLYIWHNIPIISWLLLKGRCYFCHSPIGFRYVAVEIFSAISTGFIAYYFGFSYFTLAIMFFNFTLITIALIDFDTQLIPDQITMPLLWSGLIIALLNITHVTLADALIGAIAGYLSLWFVYWGFKILTGKDGMGYGDFKLLAAFGSWFGVQSLPFIILFASIIGIILGYIQLKLAQKSIQHTFAFAPSLVISAWIYLFWGKLIIKWYLG